MIEVVSDTDGTEEQFTHIRSETSEDLGKMDMARIFVPRDEVNNSSLEELESIIELWVSSNLEFGGLLRDIVYRGTEVELIVDSYEKFMMDSQPSDAVSRFEDQSDRQIIRNIVGDAPVVSRGNIQTIESSLSFTFSHSTPAKEIREIEGVTQGELRFTPHGNVDYVNQVGRDKTSVTISPDSGKLDGSFRVNKVGDNRVYTHLRALGAGEGEYQLVSEAISPTFSSGDREKWGIVTNKSITDNNTLDVFATTLINETDEKYLELEGTVINQDVRLGDEFTISYPEKSINTALRAVGVETKRTEDGVKYRCKFSNRQKTRFDIESKDKRDIERFNKSIQGGAVPINASSGRQTVDDGFTARLKFFYPDRIINELRINIRVAGRKYRDSSGGSVAETSDFPSNCDVLVNGNSLGTSFGDGTGAFQEVVAAEGVFNQGEINTIDVTSDTLGDISFIVEGDVYRQTFSA